MSKLVAGNWKMFGNKAMLAEIKKIDQHCTEITMGLQYALLYINLLCMNKPKI